MSEQVPPHAERILELGYETDPVAAAERTRELTDILYATLSPSGRDLALAEERYLREQIKEIHQAFRAQIKPYVDRLAALEAQKHPVVWMDLSQIEERILAHMKEKTE